MYHKQAHVLNSNPIEKEKEKEDDVITLEIGPKMSVQTYPVIFSKQETEHEVPLDNVTEKVIRRMHEGNTQVRNKTADAYN